MRITLVTRAAFWPFEREMIKSRPELKITGSDQDRTVDEMIQSAVEAYEEYSQQILRESTWDLYLDSFPREIETPAPLISVDSISYLDESGTLQPLSDSVYTVDTSGRLTGRISLKHGQSWPYSLRQANAVVVRILAGYANPDSIPRLIKDGMLLKMQEILYGTDLSLAYEACWATYRRIPI